MSRVSLNRRLQTILEQAERIDPTAARVHKMAPPVRLQFDRWRAECNAEHARFAGDAMGAAYAALLSGEFVPLQPPRAVADVLQLPALAVLTTEMTPDDLARLWADLIDG